MERNLIEHKTGNLDPEIGKEIVEDIKKFQEELDEDITDYLEKINLIEQESIDFYIDKCINNLDTWIVISNHIHPTEEESLKLMFKIIDIIKILGYEVEKSYNKIKVK